MSLCEDRWAFFVIYRLYCPEDFTALYAIEQVCFEPRFRFGRGYMRSLIDDANSATWIAEEDGGMAGFAIVDWRREEAGLIAYLQTIEVRPEKRGCGAGTELLERVETSARAVGAVSIWLHVDEQNSLAVRLYEAHGYTCKGRQRDYYAQEQAALIYRKEIG
jgi:ribosomal protein S18 acetylase RimI-like enzyme